MHGSYETEFKGRREKQNGVRGEDRVNDYGQEVICETAPKPLHFQPKDHPY